MRFSASATALALSLLPVAAGLTAANPAAMAQPAVQTGPAAATSGSDAAARHAKRTACLKDAKAKKLVGANRTAYVKGCVATP
jgi:hypothetical protein